ncbi:hypothetical protein CLV47_11041 [Antricoccus suffuscus]|uniref:Fe/B12 periplasmic-binding domain-containing protein n=1 Tax=Antricoccus suffuscus TaxID=1629062 RepID=A0A2T0ZYE7_9ACTN|nr:helical backbone metal receptor [Antricoccus suffuscus]PRZ41314.1 hypothetical protein CLV47_11041 [Antricoccus suffuscus]
MNDDLRTPFVQRGPVRRVVSLVPSLTETIAYAAPEVLVGGTAYCTHPASLDVTRVGGTKWPDLDAVVGLRPDVVVANAEENRAEDIAALRAAGLAVYVTAPATLDEAFTSLERMLAALQLPAAPWIGAAREEWSTPDPQLAGQRVAVFIWRRPWMVVGRDTFSGDILRRLGLVNVYADNTDRYPKLTPEEAGSLDVDLVVLPDEPYEFNATDGPEMFGATPCALVSGRHLTWYGPSLVEAKAVLSAALRSPIMSI